MTRAMIEDSKRREVARKLRDAAKRDGSVDFDGVNSLESCVFGEITCSTWASILYSLADLVDRPTCAMAFDRVAGMVACSGCGEHFAVGAYYLDRGAWNYCPNCGAVVVG